jgi:hypothetical protein
LGGSGIEQAQCCTERSVPATVGSPSRSYPWARQYAQRTTSVFIQPPPGPFHSEARELANLTEARLNPSKRGDGYAPDHWCRSIYGYRSYRRAGNRPRLSLLSARSGLGLSRQLSIHLPLAMRSHSFWDFFVLWYEPPFCIWMAAAFCKWMAAATSACISGVVSRAGSPLTTPGRPWCGFGLRAVGLPTDPGPPQRRRR